jgi:hypothetical protein
MFGKKWESGQGTVVAANVAKLSSDGTPSVREYIVDVRSAAGETFRAKVGDPRIVNDFKPPSAGAVVGVEIDAASRRVRFEKGHPALSWKAYEAAKAAAFEQRLNLPPGT